MHSAKTPLALAALLASASLSCASDVEPASGSPADTGRRETTAPAGLEGPSNATETLAVATADAEVYDDSLRFASLVPEGTFAWVQVQSLDDLIRIGDEILAVAGGEGDSMSFEDLMGLFPTQGVIEHIDPEHPLGLAVGFIEGTTTPGATVVIPALDRAAVIQGLRNMPGAPQVFGIDNYVVATTMPGYEPGHGSAALTEGLPEGQIVVRFDVPAFVEATGEMVELALWQMKTEAEMPGDAGGPATELEGEMRLAVVEALAQGVSAAASVDLALSLVGDELDLSISLLASEDSELDGLLPAGSSNLRELAHLVDADDSLSMLMTVDAETIERLIPLWTGAVEAAGVREGHYDAAAVWMRDFAGVWPLMGETIAVTGATGAGNLHLCYFFQPTDRDGFVEGLTAAFSGLDEITPGLRILGPAEIEGETRFFFTVEEAAEGVNLEELMRREEDLQRLFGTTEVPVRLAEKNGTSVLTIGGDDDLMARSLARLERAPDDIPASLLDVLERVEGASPAFVAQVDFVALARDLLTLIDDRIDGDVALDIPDDERPLPVTYYGGVEGREWRLGFRTDFRRFGELLRRVR